MPFEMKPQFLLLSALAVSSLMGLVFVENAEAAVQTLGAQTPAEFADLLKARLKDLPDSLKKVGPQLAHETIWLVGDGTIQDAAGGKGKAPASGSIGVRHESALRALNVLNQPRTLSVERFLAFYGFGTSVDTVRGSDPTTFGASILPPSVVGRKLSFFGDYSSLQQLRKTGVAPVPWRVNICGII